MNCPPSHSVPRGPEGVATQQFDPTASDGAVEDIAGEFPAIKDSLQHVKLPPDLRFNDATKQGIKCKGPAGWHAN